MVVEHLRRGQENARSTAELVRLTGCKSPRDLQHRIAQERAQGHLILSSACGGYFLPQEGAAGRAEVERFCATLRARALNTLRALRDAKRRLAVLEGQGMLESGSSRTTT